MKMLNKTVANANPSGAQLDTSLLTQHIATRHYALLLLVYQPVFSLWDSVSHPSSLEFVHRASFLEKLHQMLSLVTLFHQCLWPHLKIIILSGVLSISHLFFWLPCCLSFCLKLILFPYWLCFVSIVYIFLPCCVLMSAKYLPRFSDLLVNQKGSMCIFFEV